MKVRFVKLSMILTSLFCGQSQAGAYTFVDVSVISLCLVAVPVSDASWIRDADISLAVPIWSMSLLSDSSFSFVASPAPDPLRLQSWVVTGHIHALDSDPMSWCLLPDSSNPYVRCQVWRTRV